MEFAGTTIACFFLLIATVSNAADVYQVTYVYDGDTVKLRTVEARKKVK